MSLSRAQVAYEKRRKKKTKEYKQKEFEPKNINSTRYSARADTNDNIADHEFTEKYSVTYHAAHRFLQRVFKQEVNTSLPDLKKAAILISKNLPLLEESSEGKYPLMDEYTAIVKNGIVVTILNKKD